MRATTDEELSFQWFHFYTRAHLGAIEVTVLSLEAEACYVRLLSVQWEAHAKGQPHLPLDPNHLRALTSKATPAQWKDIWPEIEAFFPITEDGAGRRNPALWTQREDTIAFRAKQRENGSKGGRPPKPRESQTEPNGSERPRKQKPKQKPEESDGFPVGSGWVHENTENGNPTETLKLLAVPALSPPPGGGGSFPAAAGRVLPFGKANSNSAPTADPFADGDPINVNDVLATLPEDSALRTAVSALLLKHAEPHQWWGWRDELNRLATTESDDVVPVPWTAIGQGLRELMLINPKGQRITMSAVDTFARAVMRRQLRANIAGAGPVPVGISLPEDPFTENARRRAIEGDPEFIAYCRDHGIALTA